MQLDFDEQCDSYTCMYLKKIARKLDQVSFPFQTSFTLLNVTEYNIDYSHYFAFEQHLIDAVNPCASSPCQNNGMYKGEIDRSSSGLFVSACQDTREHSAKPVGLNIQ